MVWLATFDQPVAVASALRQLIWPVHPEDASVDVVLVAGADLENPGDPVVSRPFEGSGLLLVCVCQVLLPLDACIVGDEDEALAEIFDVVDWNAEDSRLAGARAW